MWCIFIPAFGQEVSVRPLVPVARFFADSVVIGQPVKLSLTVQYESQRRILLPDTSHSFAPFELLHKEFFPTRTLGGISRDCVLYSVATFDLDSVQQIQLPVYEFISGDSLVYPSNPASLRVLTRLPAAEIQKPVFRSETGYLAVPKSVNYPFLLLGLGAVVLILFGINVLFNRPIQRFIYQVIENRRHQAFLRQFDRIKTLLERNLTTKEFEQLLVLWKRYIQRVDGKPFTTFTSTEISQVIPDSNLRKALSEIDRWIYGGLEMSDWRRHVESLKEVSVKMFLQKKEAIRSGKLE